MWQVDERRKMNNTRMPLITANWQVLHFDEVPILFTGTNALGNRIVGSSAAEDREHRFERFIHAVIDIKSYVAFIHQEITYKRSCSKQPSFTC